MEHDGRIVFVDREPGGCYSRDDDLAVADEAAKFCARLDAEIAVDPSEVGFSSRAFGHRYYGSDGVHQRLNRNTRCTRRRRFGKVEAQFAGLPRRYGYLYFEGRVTAFRAGVKTGHPLAVGKCGHQFRIFRREKTN